MKDTKNLKRKIAEIEKQISILLATGQPTDDYLESELKNLKERVANRDRNRKKNAKQKKKAGH